MSEFTVEDVEKAIKSTNSWGEGFYETVIFDEVWNKIPGYESSTFEVPGLGTATVLEVETGKGRGTVVDPDYYADPVWNNWVIFELQGRYFRLNGKYDSWDGSGPSDLEEVEKIEKTITVWEKKLDY